MSQSPYNPIHTCRRFRSVGVFQYSADFTKATSGIWVRWPHLDVDGEWRRDDNAGWQPLPYQVADVGYSRKRAEKLIADHFR